MGRHGLRHRENLGLDKQAAFRVRLGQNKEGFRLYSIEGDTTRFQHGFAGGSVTEDRPGTGPDPTMITPDSENPEPDGKPPGKNPQVKNLGGNPKSKTYCGQHLIGLLNLGDACSRDSCKFNHPATASTLNLD